MLPTLFSFLFTVATLGLLLRFNFAAHIAIDLPNHRSLHTSPIPRIGGVIVAPAFLLSWLWLPGYDAILAIIIASLALFSYLDDRSGLPIVLRFISQLAAAVFFLTSGVDSHSMAWILMAMLWIVWCTNLYNFMDGSDGLAGGMTLFGFSVLGISASDSGNQDVAAMCFSVAAASAGFLLFNFAPAKVFMGDAGSISLGFLMGALGMLGWRTGLWPLWFPMLVFSPFILDASATLLKRLLHRERIWQAHRDHYYQRLVRMGWSHRRLALSEYGLMAACGASALLLLNRAPWEQYVGLLAWVTLYGVMMITVDIHWKKYQRKTSQS